MPARFELAQHRQDVRSTLEASARSSLNDLVQAPFVFAAATQALEHRVCFVRGLGESGIRAFDDFPNRAADSIAGDERLPVAHA